MFKKNLIRVGIIVSFIICFLFAENKNTVPKETPPATAFDFSNLAESKLKTGITNFLQCFGYEKETKKKASDTKQFECVKLVRVVDGDTLVVKLDGIETKVRLIGIDTPESVSPNKARNNKFGKRASKHTKKILRNKSEVYLEYDTQKKDPYDRILAYVWLIDVESTELSVNIAKDMLNAKILSDGYAQAKVYKPNIKYSEIFRDLRHKAKKNNVGLWKFKEFRQLW